jgi:hypothetical protein
MTNEELARQLPGHVHSGPVNLHVRVPRAMLIRNWRWRRGAYGRSRGRDRR